MNKEKEIVILSGFMGFAIGVCVMMFVNLDKEVRQVERFDETKFIYIWTTLSYFHIFILLFLLHLLFQ